MINSYTHDLEVSHKKAQQLHKQQLAERDHIEDIDHKIATCQFMQSWNESIKQKNELKQKTEIVHLFAGKLPYNQYLIIYDLCNGSYYQIADDLRRNKISDTDIKIVVDKINNVYQLFNYQNVLEFIALN